MKNIGGENIFTQV